MEKENSDNLQFDLSKMALPTSPLGREIWKQEAMYGIWDALDAKSYALFLVLDLQDKEQGWNTLIRQSLLRRSNNNEENFNKFVAEIGAAFDEVTAELKTFPNLEDGLGIMLDALGTDHLQLRFVPLATN